MRYIEESSLRDCSSLIHARSVCAGLQLAESDAARAAALAAPGFVTHHRTRLRTTTLWMGGLLAAYAALILTIMAPLLLELAQGPVPLEQAVVGALNGEPAKLARRYVTLEDTRALGTETFGRQGWMEDHSFQGRWLRARQFEHRWAALTIPNDLELPSLVPALLEDERLLVKTSVALDDRVPVPWVGILTVLGPDSDQPGERAVFISRSPIMSRIIVSCRLHRTDQCAYSSAN